MSFRAGMILSYATTRLDTRDDHATTIVKLAIFKLQKYWRKRQSARHMKGQRALRSKRMPHGGIELNKSPIHLIFGLLLCEVVITVIHLGFLSSHLLQSTCPSLRLRLVWHHRHASWHTDDACFRRRFVIFQLKSQRCEGSYSKSTRDAVIVCLSAGVQIDGGHFFQRV